MTSGPRRELVTLYTRFLDGVLSGVLARLVRRLPADRQFARLSDLVAHLLEGLPEANRYSLLYRQIEATMSVASLGSDSQLTLLREMMATRLEPSERFHVPGLERRQTEPLNTWTYQNQRLQLDIKNGERVLDIGSGGWPFRRATHLADLHPDETTHRKESLKRDGRPFLVLDIHHMPFRDKVWDFTFCSHVLEHLERPGEACRELMRVSRRGYIEVPTRLSDVMLNFTRIQNHHRWHGLLLGRTLLFVEWTDGERRDVGTNFFYQCLHSMYQNSFQRMFEDNWSMFYAMLPWRDQFDFMVIDKNGAILDKA
jgi:ubiquinone/menaquinone biosynthesis C-methylase UbiE